MIKVKKENKVFTITENEKKSYLKNGYSVIDEKGKIIESLESDSKGSKEIDKYVAKLEKLTSELETVKTENEKLTSELEAVKTELEEAKLAKIDK